MSDVSLFDRLTFSDDGEQSTQTHWRDQLSPTQENRKPLSLTPFSVSDMRQHDIDDGLTPSGDPCIRRLVFELDLDCLMQRKQVVLLAFYQTTLNDIFPIHAINVDQLRDQGFNAFDVELTRRLQTHLGAAAESSTEFEQETLCLLLDQAMLYDSIGLLATHKRVFLRTAEQQLRVLELDLRLPYQLRMQIDRDDEKSGWKLWGRFINQGGAVDQPFVSHELDLWQVTALLPCGLIVSNHRLYSMDSMAAEPLIRALLIAGPVFVPHQELIDALRVLFQYQMPQACDCHSSIRLEHEVLSPRPTLYIKTSVAPLQKTAPTLKALMAFKYEIKKGVVKEFPVDGQCSQPCIDIQHGSQMSSETVSIRVMLRDRAAETAALKSLASQPEVRYTNDGEPIRIATQQLLGFLYRCLNVGWELWAENLKIRIMDDFFLQMSHDNNWFEISAHAADEQPRLNSWQLFMLLKKKSLFVVLDDGTAGLLPEKWYAQLQQLATVGQVNEDRWQLPVAAGLFVDDTLTEDGLHLAPDANALMTELRGFSGIRPRAAASSFQATLRPYQALGLSWLHHLRRLRLGGCLADDMGLGKTLQVIAFLEDIRLEQVSIKQKQPSLLILPKTLIGHWLDSCQQFAPQLRVGVLHALGVKQFDTIRSDQDLWLLSYGVVRVHIERLKAFSFHCVILDEAQAIKNANSKTSQAVKQLNAEHRLAMTGTPIENHPKELFSLFDFLNPGLLQDHVYQLDLEEGLEQLTKLIATLKPLILRRLKQEVLQELPEKTEHSVKLALSQPQQQLYQDIKLAYQQRLQDHVQSENMLAWRHCILEGLLRLRQVCCDARLLGAEAPVVASCKIEYCLETFQKMIEGNHKALVFSQFTTFLKLLGEHLDAAGMRYAYLDGATEQRDQVVQSFKSDPSVHFFLIGLKSGGFGLNLTEADYCFLLDPWWNPAVEQQAADRMHRIGQTKQTCVYKLICENTIEEKMQVLQLQKKHHADLIGSSSDAYLEALSLDDLAELFV